MNRRATNRILIAGALIAVGAALAAGGWAGVAWAGAAADQGQPANFLPNASFEQAAGKQPRGWRTGRWAGGGTFEYAAVGRTGKRSVMIASDQGADIAWTGTAAVEPYSTYRLSGWIKTEDVKTTTGRGALLNLHNIQPVATPAVTGTRDWTRVEVVFETDEQDAVEVNCLLGGWGLATGKAWYDDLRLELISTKAPDKKPRITIDAGKVGEPISKYIYGQFIEHLGRCIYGGIWAEMLEDRKFYYPITAKYEPYAAARRVPGEPFLPVVKASPWEIIGPADSVVMVKEDPFVGAHTPRIAPGSGIRQNDLGLVEGKDYVGYIWLKPAADSTAVEVALRWGKNPKDSATSAIANAADRYHQPPFRFTAGATTDTGALEIRVTGGGPCLVGTVSLMPADNVQGMRADTLAVLKELDSPVYRWPGGNFVSGYNWRDGIGPRDRRPPRKNPAWTGVEHNDFGLHEFVAFCRLLNTEPYVAVNSGLGGAKEAADEVQYANGGPDTPMGKLRLQDGHLAYRVKFWSIGNEMYGRWQLGHIPLEQYVKRHNQFAEAMRAADPAIKLVAVGDAGPWSEGMLRNCADHMDLISEHFYCQERPGLRGHVRQIPNAVRAKAEAHRKYRRELDSLKGKDIRIALDEWNYWYGGHAFGELGTRYFLKDALGIAAGLNEMARHSEMFYMANYAQTVNVIGCIKTTKTAAAMETTGLALALYRKHFGVIPVATECSPLLDAMAAWSADRKTLTVAVVNPGTEPSRIALEVKGAVLTGSGTRWQIAGRDPMAYNDPGKPPRVAIEESPVAGISDSLEVVPLSVTLFALGVK